MKNFPPPIKSLCLENKTARILRGAVSTPLVLLPLALLSGCALLFKATPPSAEGVNPITSGATLTAATMPMSYPAYSCEPGRIETKYELSVEGDQICVTFTGGVMREKGKGPPRMTEAMMASLRVAGKSSAPFELKPVSRPEIGAECYAKGQSDYIDWAIDAKGCARNDGLLTAESTGLDVLSDKAQTYATFHFAPGAASGTSVTAKK